ncbi:glucose-6-phosphate dehydrogenase assembly protein OpcA [Mangrovactinospora gilvigrisea]|uniref:Glucose-6-phosphate dehydrogenase assembly protein OpcA n=1 Tax=Mangrovactinospora gilvigrisea TaxID=1428644 RepID=A0A1J7BZQ6_9ACTN|nr:glucose-6-phosphate dehydrogenase assembly protein OpcA [Mangrovactinospora gilvigrisea]OIV38969.1 glucose-6-phosphate dehydrogenase assembly protein OpcA [Mangrovactinospora gilvigrisea]
MKIELTDTTSSKINAALVQARRAVGAPATGMILSMVIVTDEGSAYDAVKAAREASREHPMRILVVIRRPGKSPRARAVTRLDAEIQVGGDYGTGETILLRLNGELTAHADSVVLPLLLPDAPTVAWWPESAPEDVSQGTVGDLSQRRITDAAAAEDPVHELSVRARHYHPGDTDLAWTRVTPWRSMLAAALDQKPGVKVTSAEVEGEAYNPSVELLGMWLADRLDVPVKRIVSEGPGLTAARLNTPEGQIELDRSDGLLAHLRMPGSPDRQVALKRRETAELIAEELRRLDPDDVYRATLLHGVQRLTVTEKPASAKDAAEQVEEIIDGTEPATAPASSSSASSSSSSSSGSEAPKPRRTAKGGSAK